MRLCTLMFDIPAISFLARSLSALTLVVGHGGLIPMDHKDKTE